MDIMNSDKVSLITEHNRNYCSKCITFIGKGKPRQLCGKWSCSIIENVNKNYDLSSIKLKNNSTDYIKSLERCANNS